MHVWSSKRCSKDHFCNVPWIPGIIISDDTPLNEYWQHHIDDDPKILADSNLQWGFSYCKFNNIDMTQDQLNFIDYVVTKITEGEAKDVSVDG